MPAGRPRIPTKLHLLAGNPGNHRHNIDDEPQPEPIAPDAPESFSAEVLAEWNLVVTELESLGLLARIDRGMMIGYCQHMADYFKAQKHLDTEAEVFRTESGYPVMTPWKAYRDTALMEMRKFATEMGMSASARSRIHVKPQAKESVQGVKRFLA